jgi:amidase
MAGSRSDEFAYMTITELATLLRSRKLSPIELMDSVLARVKARNESLTAFVYLNEDYARSQARVAEKTLMSGEDTGPLVGIPTAIKDLSDSRPGWPGTLGGIRALKNHIIDSYCYFAERMERAGAIPLGKTNSPTMGFRGTCDNYLFGPTRNPFDLTRNSGGSSGGSAAAVADGLVPFAEGTDGGGSIRIPAAWTNTYGFKGTAGRLAQLARPQAFGATSLFTFEGCITRTVADTALVMEAMSGHDPRDPYNLPDRVSWREALEGSVRGKREAFSKDFGIFPVDDAVRLIIEDAAKAFEEAGAHVEEVHIDLRHSARELGDIWCRLMISSSVLRTERLRLAGIDLLKDHRSDLPPELLYFLEEGQHYTVVDAMRDQEARTQVYDAIESVFETHDLLITPTLACLPVENASDGNTLGPATINGEELNRLISWCLTFPLNFTGHPAASVPAGLAEGRWPVGLQIIGRKFADADVIAASATFEKLRPWQSAYRLCAERPLE